MSYANLTAAGALAIATSIKAATLDVDRNRMSALHRLHGGIGRITKLLVAAGFMTRKERFAALATMPKVKNASCRYNYTV
jgi:hypothetical protein